MDSEPISASESTEEPQPPPSEPTAKELAWRAFRASIEPEIQAKHPPMRNPSLSYEDEDLLDKTFRKSTSKYGGRKMGRAWK
jgi:hypothetical protein